MTTNKVLYEGELYHTYAHEFEGCDNIDHVDVIYDLVKSSDCHAG